MSTIRCINSSPCYAFNGVIGPQVLSNNAISIDRPLPAVEGACCIPCTDFPITGTGEIGNCIRLEDGNQVNDTLLWDGSQWTIDQTGSNSIVTNFPIVGDGTLVTPIDLTSGNAPNTFLAWHSLPVSADEWSIYRSPVGIVDIIVGDINDRRTHFTSLFAALAATPAAETRAIRVISNIVEVNPIVLPASFFLHIDSDVSVTLNTVTITGNFYVYGRAPQSTLTFNDTVITNFGFVFSAEQVSLVFAGSGATTSNFGGDAFFRQSTTTLTVFQELRFDGMCVMEDISIIKDSSLNLPFACQIVGTNSRLTNVSLTLSTSNGIEVQSQSDLKQIRITSLVNTVINALQISTGSGTVVSDVTFYGTYPTASPFPASNFIFRADTDIILDGLRFQFNNPGNSIALLLSGTCKNVHQVTGNNRMYALLASGSSLENATLHELTTSGSTFITSGRLRNITMNTTLQVSGAGPTFIDVLSSTSSVTIDAASNLQINNVRCTQLSIQGNNTSNVIADNIHCTTVFNYGPVGSPFRNIVSNVFAATSASIQNVQRSTMSGVVCSGTITVVGINQNGLLNNLVTPGTVNISGCGTGTIANVTAMFITVATSSFAQFSGFSFGGTAVGPGPTLTVANTVNNCVFSDISALRESANQSVDSNIVLNCNNCTFSNIGGGQLVGRSFDLTVSGNDNTLTNVNIPGTISDETLQFLVTGSRNKFSNISLGTPTQPFGRNLAGTVATNHLFQVRGVSNQFTNLYMYPTTDVAVPLQRVWVMIGDPSAPNSLTDGAFNQFTNCTFFRDTDANYAPSVSIPPVAGSSSQPIYVFGRHNLFKNVRIGPETEGAPLTDSHIDLSTIALPLNGVVDTCMLPTGNANVNAVILNQNTFYTY